MIFTPNSMPTEITLNTDNNIVTISQKQFGSDEVKFVIVDLDNLKEFLTSVEA